MEEDKSDKAVSKIVLDKQSFQFKAAYSAYSKTWNEELSEEDKVKLNDMLLNLSEGHTTYPVFYRELNSFRGEYQTRLERTFIKGQRKRDWRRSEASRARRARHKR